MNIRAQKAAKKGFSLVEMLVVIAVIGIIAAIAVPNIGRINDSAKDATARRNAQNIASVYASAQAAGLDFATAAGSTAVADIIGAIITGATINDTDSPFHDTYFGIPGLDSTTAVDTSDAGAAINYLTWDTDAEQLLYTGGQ